MKGACQWTKDGFGLGTDPNLPGFPRFSMDEDKPGDCHLNIFPVLPEDEGLYECQVGAVPGMAAIKSDTAKVTVIAPPGQPYIKQAKVTDTLEVLEGEEVVLDCETHGAKPAAEIQWTDQDGKVIMSNLLETVTKLGKTKTFKTVSTLKMTPKSKMSITCSAFSDAFKEPRNSRKLTIQLKYKPKLSLNVTNENIKEGMTLVVKCASEAYPSNVTYNWFINDDEMMEHSDTFTIENVSKDMNNAVLRCEADNSVGKSETSTILNVEFIPKILTHPTSEIAKYGDEVTLTCLAEGNPEPNYVWVKGKSQELVGVSQNITLTATDDTEDEYTCKVFVEGHKLLISETATLRIMRKPNIFTETVKYAKIGDDVILQCRVESLSNNTKVTWTKNNEPIDREHVKHKILHTDGLYQFASDLIIYNIEERDFTNYGCFSSNEVGTDYKVFPLEEEEESDYVTIAITINTIVGIIILVFLLIYHNKKKRSANRAELPTVQRQVLPPIYRGNDPSVFNELLLDKGMHEEYLHISKEYFDNNKVEKVKDLRIV
eukprot:GFUD01000476.1.p1 GENE.GFUD01000476.1~~GFUD01000476.1.p1  ORF type:complete len:622 (-),score=168.19 GFUD01000476.1:456-2087(-)